MTDVLIFAVEILAAYGLVFASGALQAWAADRRLARRRAGR